MLDIRHRMVFGTPIALKIRDALSLFPQKSQFYERGNQAMRIIQRILFAFVMVAGLSFAVAAQKEDKKLPPKGTPPVVTPQPKNPPPDKPKKPSFALTFGMTEPRETASS